MSQTLFDLQVRAWAIKADKGFNTTDVPLNFMFLVKEVAEAFDAWKAGDDVGPELADVVILAAGLAQMTDVDLDAAVTAKLDVIERRTYVPGVRPGTSVKVAAPRRLGCSLHGGVARDVPGETGWIDCGLDVCGHEVKA